MQKGIQSSSTNQLERKKPRKKLWIPMKALNGERKKSAPIVIEKYNEYM